MYPINIYALTRTSEPERLARMERMMSRRHRPLKIKDWEVEGLKAFSETLCASMEEASDWLFFYSFTLPKLGKEFDLLRISDACVINIEIKSMPVADKAIQKQLLQNRHYLSPLGKPVRSYTFINSTGRLCRLSNSGRLLTEEPERLTADLAGQGDCYEGPIEDLFREELYLISPLTDTARFLRREYFLTSQQTDIRRRILRGIKSFRGSGQETESPLPIFGFSGLPGTGKSILLYDLAMELSQSDRVCLMHFGSHARELEQLDLRLKRVDFLFPPGPASPPNLPTSQYRVILVDEGHRMTPHDAAFILDLANSLNSPVIVSYDEEDSVSPQERPESGMEILKTDPGFVACRLTNRIRLNRELSMFIRGILHISAKHPRRDYPHVALFYASNPPETLRLLHGLTVRDYTYIRDTYPSGETASLPSHEDIDTAICKEFDRIVMCLDEGFYYDARGYLRHHSTEAPRPDMRVRNLFHGLSRAKRGIAIIVQHNPEVFDRMLGMVIAAT